MDNQTMLSKRREQLKWFLSQLILLSKKPVNIEGYDELICFPVSLLKKEMVLFPIDKDILKISDLVEEECVREYIEPMLEKIKKDVHKLDNKDLSSCIEKFSWLEDDNYYGHGRAYFIDCEFVPLFKAYLKYLLNLQNNVHSNNNEHIIEKIEVLEDKNEQKKIVMFINGNYDRAVEFNRREYLGSFYTLARDKEIPYEKGLFDYFNSNKINPLYIKEGYKITKILKQEFDLIVPNIKIELITQKKITQRLK